MTKPPTTDELLQLLYSVSADLLVSHRIATDLARGDLADGIREAQVHISNAIGKLVVSRHMPVGKVG